MPTKKIIFVNAPANLEETYRELAAGGNQLAHFGLVMLASVCKENGFETKVIDGIALNLSYKETLKRVINEKPDFVAITAATANIHQAATFAKDIKKNGITTIIGGYHLSALPEETMKKFPDFDTGVIGEGELTIIELLNTIRRNGDLNRVKGIIFREKDKLKVTEKRPFIEELDSLPLPRWELLPGFPDLYLPPADGMYRLPSSLIVTSRGCPMRCTFCTKNVFGNLYRKNSAEYVIKMIKDLYYGYGVKEIQIYEENFVADHTRLKEICNRLIEEKMDLNWCCMASANMVNPEILKLMKKAGCWQVAYGIESGSDVILRHYKKGSSVEQNRKAIRWTKEAGIRCKGFFMHGNPLETKETIKETLRFIKESNLDDFHVLYFVPLPGSELYDDIGKYGTVDKDWKKVSFFGANFIPNGMTRDEIEHYYKKAWRSFYLRPKTVIYFLRKMKNPVIRKKIIKAGLGFLQFVYKKD